MNIFLESRSGTYADTLHAIGTASLLSDLGYSGAVIRDRGAGYEITTRTELADGAWPSSIDHGYLYVWDSSDEPQRPQFPEVLDYQAERAKRDAFNSLTRAARARIEAGEIESPPEPHPETGMAAIVASLRSRWKGDRDLAHWIQGHQSEALNACRSALGFASASPVVFAKVSNSQILNPTGGKGVSGPKTRIQSSGSLPGHLTDSFAEWMKIRGMWSAMLAYRTGKDFRIFVIEPADIPFENVRQLRTSLLALKLWGGGVKIDITATLSLLGQLVFHSDVKQSTPSSIPFRGRSPRQVIHGLRQAFFKNLGTAAALMNDAMLPMPDWFPLHHESDADTYLAIIAEMIDRKAGCLNSLQEDISDDNRVLQLFREWLLTGTLEELMNFHHAFALHLMQRFTHDKWARAFSTMNLSALLIRAYKEQNMTEIIEDPGFISIARAIRESTVDAVRAEPKRREVRFGLAHKWKQKIKSGDEDFVVALSDFVQQYNWETANRLKGFGHKVTTEELQSVLALIDSRRAELVGSLLLAYGFARVPKTERPQPESEVASA